MGARVERYSLGITHSLRIGEACDFEPDQWVMRLFHPDTRRTNAPCPGFVTLRGIVVDGIEVLYDEARQTSFEEDAWDSRDGREFDAVSCDHGVRIIARYSGLVPAGWTRGALFTFCVRLDGLGG